MNVSIITALQPTVVAGTLLFLLVTLLLVVILLVAKRYLVHTGKVSIEINGERRLEADSGKSLLSTMADNNVFLPSACGGKGSCGQCKVQVFEGGGDVLPTEAVHFTRKEMKDSWRLGCQVKVKQDMKIGVPASVLDIKEWECEVISNRNVATFIKEFIVALPPGVHMVSYPDHTLRSRYLPTKWTTIAISTRALSARNTFRHGRSSDCSRSNAATPRLPYAPTPWPTIRPRATA